MPFFVKLTSDCVSWGWGYARTVEPTKTVVKLTGFYAPCPGAPPMPLAGGTYPWSLQTGWLHAYPVLCDLPWLASAPVQPRYPGWVPAEVVDCGLDAVVGYVLRGSRLRSLFSSDAVSRCVAEDLALEDATPYLRAPLFLPADDTEFERWQQERPEAYRFASEDADAVVAAGNFRPEVALWRRRLRLEAHRKLDREREDFALTPSIAHEPHVIAIVGSRSLTFGRSKHTWYLQGVGAPPIRAEAKNQAIIEAVEAAILPGHAALEDRLTMYPWALKFAEWEEKSPYPAFGATQWSADVPAGLVPRQGLKEPGPDLSPFGIYPLISPPALEYLQTVKLRHLTPHECAAICLQRAWRL